MNDKEVTIKLQTHPVKVYIQDIYRANRTEEDYIYEFLGMRFKNIMIHGFVTATYNKLGPSINFELTDSTSTIQVYYDSRKNKNTIKESHLNHLISEFNREKSNGKKFPPIMQEMKDMILAKAENPIEFTDGDYVSVVGDIFLNDVGNRMISAYECNVTSVEREVLWLEELQYIYEKYYLWKKVEIPQTD